MITGTLDQHFHRRFNELATKLATNEDILAIVRGVLVSIPSEYFYSSFIRNYDIPVEPTINVLFQKYNPFPVVDYVRSCSANDRGGGINNIVI
jgi:hypothetical protein